MSVLDKVTDFLFLLGKLLIVGSVGECCLPSLLGCGNLLVCGVPVYSVGDWIFVGLLPLAKTLSHLGFVSLSRDPGFLLLHPPYQDHTRHSTASQLLLGSYTGMELWGWAGVGGEGGIETQLALFDWTVRGRGQK